MVHFLGLADETRQGELARLYEDTATQASFGAWQCDLRDNALTWTSGVYDLFGLPRGGAIERSAIVDLYGDESRRQMERLRSEAIRTGGSFSLDARIFPRTGEARWMRLIARTETMADGTMRLLGSKQDVTADYDLLERLKAEVGRDPQTGLADRRYFETRLQQIADQGLHHGRHGSLTLIDVQALPDIETCLGSKASDACLRDIATRLLRATDRSAILARIGAREFALLQPPSPFNPPMRQHLVRLSRIAKRPYFWDDHCIDYRIATATIPLDQGSSPHAADLMAQARAAFTKPEPEQARESDGPDRPASAMAQQAA